MDNLTIVTAELVRAAHNGEIDFRIGWIAEGFSYARNSCRLSGEIELRLRSLTKRQARALVMRVVADERVTMGDVSRWLIKWHFGKEAVV